MLSKQQQQQQRKPRPSMNRDLLKLVKKGLQTNGNNIAAKVSKSATSGGVSISGKLADVKTKKYEPLDPKKKAEYPDAGTFNVKVFVASLSGTIISPQEGKLDRKSQSGTASLTLYGKHKKLIPEADRSGPKKWDYVTERKISITISENSTFYVSMFLSTGFNAFEKKILSHAAKLGDVIITGIIPVIYTKKDRSLLESEEHQHLVPDIPEQQQQHQEQVDDHGDEHNPIEADVNLEDHRDNDPEYGLNINAKEIVIIDSTGDPYCRLIQTLPPFSKCPVPKIVTPPPADDVVLKILAEKYAGNDKKYGTVRDGIWKKLMTTTEQQFYSATQFFELGPVELETIARVQVNVVSHVKPSKNTNEAEEIRLQAVSWYSQPDPTDETKVESFYLSFSLKKELCFKLLQIADINLWAKIARFHLPNVSVLGWIDVGDILSRQDILDDNISFGLKIVPQAVVSGLAYYLVNHGFSLPPECVRKWLYLATGRPIDDGDNGLVEVSEIPDCILEDHHSLGASPSVINMLETNKTWNLRGNAVALYNFYTLIGQDFLDKYEIYESWADRKSEIIASVFSGEEFGSVTADERKLYSDQFGFVHQPSNHIAMNAVIYAVKKTTVDECLKAKASGRKQCDFVPSLVVEAPQETVTGESNNLNQCLDQKSIDQPPNQNTTPITIDPTIITNNLTPTQTDRLLIQESTSSSLSLNQRLDQNPEIGANNEPNSSVSENQEILTQNDTTTTMTMSETNDLDQKIEPTTNSSSPTTDTISKDKRSTKNSQNDVTMQNSDPKSESSQNSETLNPIKEKSALEKPQISKSATQRPQQNPSKSNQLTSKRAKPEGGTPVIPRAKKSTQ